MSDMVNSPSHYCTKGRPECIELINEIICGHNGLAAFCLGQVKYLYRAGKKAESGMTQGKKAIEDVSKFLWYINHLISKIKNSSFEDLDKYIRQRAFIPEIKQHAIATEFAADKEDYISERIYFIVLKLTNITNVGTYDMIKTDLEELKKLMEDKNGKNTN